MQNRPPIPKAMKQRIRSRCGFGCVICGDTLYQYDHMTDWAKIKRHNEHDITLLCDKHHRLKTNNLLPVELVREHDANPYNLDQDLSQNEKLYYSSPNITIALGCINFMYTTLPKDGHFIPLIIDRKPIIEFRIENNILYFSFLAFDDNNQMVMKIVDNELCFNLNNWDIERVGQSIVIRDASKKIKLQIKFEPPHKVSIIRGQLQWNGIELLIHKDYVFFSNVSGIIGGDQSNIIDVPIGIGVGKYLSGCVIKIGITDRKFDRTASLKNLIKKRIEVREICNLNRKNKNFT